AYTEPDEDVQRNDELEDPATGEVYRVKGLLRPSQDCIYLRMDCTYVQAEDVIGGESWPTRWRAWTSSCASSRSLAPRSSRRPRSVCPRVAVRLRRRC